MPRNTYRLEDPQSSEPPKRLANGLYFMRDLLEGGAL